MFRYDGFPLNGPAWSLVLEFIFYLITPLLILLRKKYLVVLMMISILIYYLILRYHHLIHDHYIQTFFVPANIFFFIFGIFSYYFYGWLKKNPISVKLSFKLSLLFILFIFFWQYVPQLYFRHILLNEWFTYVLTPFFLPFIFESFNKFPLNNFLAGLSYPLYICHMVSIDLLQNIFKYKIGSQFFVFCVLIITFAVGLGLVYAVEKPIDNFRQKRVSQK